MDKDFVETNKQMLLEEMSTALNNLTSVIEQTSSETPSENDSEMLRNSLIAYQIGSLRVLFNQFQVLTSGIIPKENSIGFGRTEEMKENARK